MAGATGRWLLAKDNRKCDPNGKGQAMGSCSAKHQTAVHSFAFLPGSHCAVKIISGRPREGKQVGAASNATFEPD
eukprot:10864596-Alexandrium_andersonii.AAC.1